MLIWTDGFLKSFNLSCFFNYNYKAYFQAKTLDGELVGDKSGTQCQVGDWEKKFEKYWVREY